MADIELVIKIPEEMYKWVNDANKIINDYGTSDFIDLVKNSTPLPKGHGRLIDANSIYQVVRPIEPSDSEWGMTAETAKQIIHDAFNRAPTIIEADRSDAGMSKEEYNKIIHLMNHGALHGVDTGRLDGKREDVIPLEDAIAIVDLVYESESEE